MSGGLLVLEAKAKGEKLTRTVHTGFDKDTGKARAAMFPAFLNSRWWETATPLYRASVCAKAVP